VKCNIFIQKRYVDKKRRFGKINDIN